MHGQTTLKFPNSYVAAVVYLAYEDVLDHACAGVFILVSVVKRSFRGCWFWYLHVYNEV